ncbi:hypothetical protein DFH08DRAFT_1028234 [Mycena albidolilacea]|uniref:Uncharacterized protein n=1 Tax=Mycena albidolilacea TaxID=1033008 RepID=A0AAD6ZIQ9_9AGAR|nr:hypothetical protein DFH08DRAFT_1028234 [Mycena albidolilacea]
MVTPVPSEQPPRSRRRLFLDTESPWPDSEEFLDPSALFGDFPDPSELYQFTFQRSPTPFVQALPTSPPPRAPITALDTWERTSGAELAQWVRTVVETIDQNVSPLIIRGNSPESMATTLCNLIATNTRNDGSILTLERGVTCTMVSDLSFLVTGRSYTIAHNMIAPDHTRDAQGRGPERTSGAFVRPAFHQDPSATGVRSEAFYVDGRYAAIHILTTEAGPMPVSPFLLFAATQTSRYALSSLTLSAIHTLDLEQAQLLQPWFELTREHVSVVSDFVPFELLQHYLPDIEDNWFHQARTREQHENVHTRFLEVFFLGISDAWAHQEFLAFRNGLDLPLGPAPGDFAPAPTLGNHWASPYTVVRHLAALYDRGVKEPEQVISCLNIVTETATANPVADIYVQLFTWRLHRWLKGVGYPEELKGIYISPAEYSAHAKSTTIRAARLLYSLTESWTLPASPSSRLRLDLHTSPYVNPNQPPLDDRAVFWHSCYKSAEIFFTPWFKNMLLEPGDLEELDTAYRFDVWMSRITSLKGGDYNRL